MHNHHTRSASAGLLCPLLPSRCATRHLGLYANSVELLRPLCAGMAGGAWGKIVKRPYPVRAKVNLLPT